MDATPKDERRQLILQIIQPGLEGLMDGSVSSLAPLFATAFATRNNHTTFLVGLAVAVGAVGHALPFLLTSFHAAMTLAIGVVIVELFAIAWIRHRYMETGMLKAMLQIVVGGAVVFIAGMLIGQS
jgi:VIT1/CCC1 family predicted Fe2+/Mn2+ transporter